ncbi:MAG: hypothetical protein KGL99_10420 [Burkholderiales bacterium]|nr:hypothetical protein [Burkholderiales bacterium]
MEIEDVGGDLHRIGNGHPIDRRLDRRLRVAPASRAESPAYRYQPLHEFGRHLGLDDVLELVGVRGEEPALDRAFAYREQPCGRFGVFERRAATPVGACGQVAWLPNHRCAGFTPPPPESRRSQP